jgi:glycogen phosphorylase
MSIETPPRHPLCTLLSAEVEGFDSLVELALDMRWSWNHATDEVWRSLDPELWDLTHHPCDVMQTVSRDKVRSMLANPAFRSKIDALVQSKKQEDKAPAWFQTEHPEASLTCVAYFCMEFMLSEALPIYSGGLGNVAGDQLKAASDMGVPVIGVGLLYQQGYFRQEIDKDGAQQALYPYNDPGQLPVTPLRHPNGEWLRLKIVLPGYSVWLRAWQVQVGRVKLYLLDSNDPANLPVHRGITSELYGGGSELRLKQELVLGMGGWRLFRALGLQPEICHLNEGHSAFAVLERAHSYMQETAHPFEVALAATRAGNIFTTHTAVAAGFDHFEPALIEQYLGRYAEQELGLSLHDLLALGRRNPNDPTERFNMAYLAIRGSRAVNGVSRLHGKVSRHLFEPLFERWPHDEIPVGYVTNGVHMPTWDSEEADELWTAACGKNRWLGMAENLEQDIRSIPDTTLWQFRIAATKSFVDYSRGRLTRQLGASGASPDAIDGAKHIFDPNALTLGFARRFATYKRPNMLLHDPERLLRLLTNPQRPVQLVLAGKAHPADLAGQAMIKEWMQFIQRPEARRHVIFFSDYNMLLSENLVQGVDVWINTPRRPWEACGTSGMKVLVNGGINLSELDGWWAEAYSPEVGWALGDGLEHGDDPAWDAAEAETLYERLEQEVIPEFYRRNQYGIPEAWVNRMRESMARLTPHFSAGRTVREYTERYYLPAAAAYHERTARNGETAAQMVRWLQMVRTNWEHVHIGEVTVTTSGEQHLFEAQVYLGGIPPDAVHVELYAEESNSLNPVLLEMNLDRQLVGAEHGYLYKAQTPANRQSDAFTARVVPYHSGVTIPLEDAHIQWQR